MKTLLFLLLTGCASGYDAGMQANLQSQAEYAQFRAENPNWNPDRNRPLIFDPDKGGWIMP